MQMGVACYAPTEHRPVGKQNSRMAGVRRGAACNALSPDRAINYNIPSAALSGVRVHIRPSPAPADVSMCPTCVQTAKILDTSITIYQSNKKER